MENTMTLNQIEKGDQRLVPLMFYLMCRSEVEKVPFELEYDFFIEMYNQGIRNFFGVEINNEGEILSDEQEPKEGFIHYVLGLIWEDRMKEEFKEIVHRVIEQYPNESVRTQFEISVDGLDKVDGWEYEEELGEIFDEIIKQTVTN